MIYLDSSVALAHLLAEDRSPPESIWSDGLVASRLLEYEVWNRIHARRLARSHGEAVRELIARLALVELVPAVLARVLEPFPVAVTDPRCDASGINRVSARPVVKQWNWRVLMSDSWSRHARSVARS